MQRAGAGDLVLRIIKPAHKPPLMRTEITERDNIFLRAHPSMGPLTKLYKKTNRMGALIRIKKLKGLVVLKQGESPYFLARIILSNKGRPSQKRVKKYIRKQNRRCRGAHALQELPPCHKTISRHVQDF